MRLSVTVYTKLAGPPSEPTSRGRVTVSGVGAPVHFSSENLGIHAWIKAVPRGFGRSISVRMLRVSGIETVGRTGFTLPMNGLPSKSQTA